ncbi:beta subunit of citrate lyase [Testicularia cyperi]|uniref:Beta subunit of citrate lyase n=1 Tax=Testicularia cyperi TaxID=1882483 RepID=A0A317XX40_9BASI|nr:beta subunit of citrate lyase [Testicularia cyperi]
MHHGAGSKSTSSSSPSSLSGTQDSASSRARRSMLYVPGSSEKMIKKSQNSTADTIIFDLEDSVAAHKKASARETVLLALEAAARPGPELSVRINPPSGDKTLAGDDLDLLLTSRQLQTIVVPKVEHEDDIRFILDKVKAIRDKDHGTISLVLSIESAASLLRMPTIIEAVRSQSQNQSDSAAKPLIEISALLFASEDYCASTGILRTSDRRSLLFPRAHMATIAKACNLSAIDMVCIEYKDLDYLHEETQEAKELGYDGKQAIHPAQVETIQSIFNPSEQQIRRAARIKHLYTLAEKNDKGAYGLKDGDRLIMIDAPMLLQAEAILGKAKAAGLEIPDVSNEAD